MSERKTETVSLQGNVQYAKVATRLLALHEDNANCDITTEVTFQPGGENTWVIVKAKITNKRGLFNGHAMAPFSGKAKFLEKLETIAVGRALAFAGYMASGDIASFEEMDEWGQQPDWAVDFGGISRKQFKRLTEDWWHGAKEKLGDMPPSERESSFAEWAKGVVGQDFDALNWRSWTPEYLSACQSAFGEVAEKALLEAGLTNLGASR